MAINTGVNDSSLVAFAVVTPIDAELATNIVALAPISTEPNVSCKKYIAYAVLRPTPPPPAPQPDTGGTYTVTLKAPGMQVNHLRIGDIVSLSNVRLGLDHQLFRILSIAADDNLNICTITMLWHDDRWFLDGFGSGNQPLKALNGNTALSRVPFAWRPYGGESPRTTDTIYTDPNARFLKTSISYNTLTDGSITAYLEADGILPVNVPGTRAISPIISFQGTVDVSSGTLPAGQYYIAILALDSFGFVTFPQPPQQMCQVFLTATGSVSVPKITWKGSTVRGAVFIGTDPGFLRFQDYIDPVSGVLPTTVKISTPTSGTTDPFPVPDRQFDHIELQVKTVRHAGPVGDAFDVVGPMHQGIMRAGADWTVNQWVGYNVAVIGSPNNTDNIPLINGVVLSNTSDTLTTNLDLTGIADGSAFIIYSYSTFSTDADGNTVLTDPNWANSLGPKFNQKVIVSVSGNGVSPIQIQTVDPHGYSTGDVVTVREVTGNTAADQTGAVTVIDDYTFTMAGTGNGDYSGGGYSYVTSGLAVDAEAGKTLRFLHPDGTSHTVNIKSNTGTTVTIDGKVTPTPAAGTPFLIEEPQWFTISRSDAITQRDRLHLNSFTADVHNFKDTTILVRVVTYSADGKYASSNQVPFRMVWVWGREGGYGFLPPAPAYYTITSTSSTYTYDVANGTVQRITLGATPINIGQIIYTGNTQTDGMTLTLLLDQDATGGRPIPNFASGTNGFSSDVGQWQISGTPSTRTTYQLLRTGGVYGLQSSPPVTGGPIT